MIWIITELYYPEETSTGHFLTKIAEGVAIDHDVSVVCSQPTYSQRGMKAPTHEVHNGVQIYRCWGGRLNKDFLPFRIVNFLTISFSLFFAGLIRFRAGDEVVVVTNPPLLPFLVVIASKIKKSTLILLVHDVYPEVLVAAGITSPKSFIFKMVQGAARWLYHQATAVIVIGRDMGRMVTSKCQDKNKIHLITNWADLDVVSPLPRHENSVLKSHSLLDSFVVQYCGNMGRTHGLEYLLESASRLLHEDHLHFLMIGSGARKNWLEKEVVNRELTNVTILPRCPRESLNENLNACDLAVVSFVPGMSGVSVPSRMYNIMAAGKPILAIADADSELVAVVKEEGIGWVVSPGDVSSLMASIQDAKSDIKRLREMGERARRVAVEKYSFTKVIKSYRELLNLL